ncbi:MAG: alkaline phosphatase family protein [Candidatus Melainabacteria bacterium]|nr:alkaline phosphatase family protein [Candidatus Melainabacteria bacterium]
MTKKVLIIGWDCAPPDWVFDKWIDGLPTLKSLLKKGVYGNLRSTIPPITVPAWQSMLTSKDPGQLGVYGFRNRKDYSYDGQYFSNGADILEPAVWDILGKAGKKSILVGVPQTYPPRPINGCMVTCFLTPSIKSQYTYPNELRDEIEKNIGEYIPDVKHFRTEDRDFILKQIYEATKIRFQTFRHLLKNKDWDFSMLVEMGTDRIHHSFWKFLDPKHPKYEKGNKYESVIPEYYKYLDNELAETLKLIDLNETSVMVVSDHGAKAMLGGICINEWLIKEGLLTLKEYPKTFTPIEKLEIDWAKTKVWGSGGYYARIFMNVQGREPNGMIPLSEYKKFRAELKEKIENIKDEQGKKLATVAYIPEDIYKEVKRVPPDLIVIFDDLRWRSVGSVGIKSAYTYENDTGPDDANHAQEGMYMLCDPKNNFSGKRDNNHHLMDIAPTVLDLLGVEVPKDMQGKSIVEALHATPL